MSRRPLLTTCERTDIVWNQGFALALPHVQGGNTKRLFLIVRSHELF